MSGAQGVQFKKGARVSIVNCTPSGAFFVEGEAVVVKPSKNEGQATVRFVRTGELAERFIDPAAQADPFGFVSELNLKVREAAGVQS